MQSKQSSATTPPQTWDGPRRATGDRSFADGAKHDVSPSLLANSILLKVAPLVEIEHDQAVIEVTDLAQACLRGKISSAQAIAKTDLALTEHPKPKMLLMTRALLRYDAQDSKGCLVDCRAP